MNKKLLAVAVGAALATSPMLVSAATTVYGKINIGIASIDNGNTADADTFGVTDDASRFGIKGDEDVGGGLKVIYQYETTVAVDDATGTGSVFEGGGRDTFAGLQGSWGSVRLGRYNVTYKAIEFPVEIFGDTIGDFSSGLGFGGGSETRQSNSIGYTSPTFAGFQAGVETSRGETGTATESNPLSVGIKWTAGPLYVAAGIWDPDNTGTTGVDDAKKFVASYAIGPFSIFGLYETRSNKGTLSATNAEVDTTYLGVSYKFGNNTVAATVAEYDSTAADGDSTQIALGWIYALSKNSALKFIWTDIDNDPAGTNAGRVVGATTSSVALAAPAAGSDPSGFQIQLSTAF